MIGEQTNYQQILFYQEIQLETDPLLLAFENSFQSVFLQFFVFSPSLVPSGKLTQLWKITILRGKPCELSVV